MSTTAPAPSPNSGSERLSSQLATREITKSAPTTTTLRARPLSIWEAPSDTPERNAVQAAPTSTAAACVAPSSYGDLGSRVRLDLVLGQRPDDHEVDVRRFQPGALERLGAGARRVVA